VSDIQQRVRRLVPALAPAERRVAEAILTDPAAAVERTITEIAAHCATSETTVVRFCRSAGFKGYPELRLALAGELGRARARSGEDVALAADITRDDPLDVLVRKLAYAERRAIEDTVDGLDLAALEQVVVAVGAARRIQLYGLGASGLAAQDLQEKLLRIGLMAYVVPDPHLAVGVAALLGPADVAIAVSHSGETADAVAFLRTAAGRGATTVAVTGAPRSAVAAAAGLVLTAAGRETVFRAGALASRIAQLAVLDCVFVGVLQRSYDRAGVALAETHGAVHGPDVGH
jgi:DNA-binding MurR/RpiR family transcriptional regulator